MKAILAQTAMELRLTARRGENLLVTLVIPLGLLVFFASVEIFSLAGQRPIDYLVPGLVALAIMSTSLVSLGIATAYERHYGVLKRLGGSPLSRPQLVTAKIAAVLAIEVVQIVLLLGTAAIFFGWRPAGNLAAAGAAAALGTAAFAGLGLLLAGSLRAEATLALANGLYLIFMLTGGIFLPLEHLPDPIEAIAPFLPATALAALTRASLGGGEWPALSLIVLTVWAAVTIGLAARLFRWE